MNFLIVCSNVQKCEKIMEVLETEFENDHYELQTDYAEAYKRILRNNFDILIIDLDVTPSCNCDFNPEKLVRAAYNIGKLSICFKKKRASFMFFNLDIFGRCKLVNFKTFKKKLTKMKKKKIIDVLEMNRKILNRSLFFTVF